MLELESPYNHNMCDLDCPILLKTMITLSLTHITDDMYIITLIGSLLKNVYKHFWSGVDDC